MPIELQTIKYEGPNNVLAWKHPIENFYTCSQLIVHESQEALFFGGGEALDLFGPGRHTLGTDNIPYVAKWYEKLFGIGKKLEAETPFHCEVYFVNKVTVMDILWGTATPIPVEDPHYGIIVPVGANGQFGIRIQDSRQFLTKLVGTTAGIGKETIYSDFKGMLMTRIKDLISNIMVRGKISFLEVHGHLNEISGAIREQVAEDFVAYGVEVVNFFINSISVPENDPGYVKIRNAKAAAKERELLAEGKARELELLKTTYERERTFGVLDKAAQNEGTASGPIGIGTGLGMGLPVGGAIGGMMAGALTNLASNIVSPASETKKTTPGNEALRDSKYSVQHDSTEEPADGVVCPACKKTVPKGKFCNQCKAQLQGKCKTCGYVLPAGSKFCPDCGNDV